MILAEFFVKECKQFAYVKFKDLKFLFIIQVSSAIKKNIKLFIILKIKRASLFVIKRLIT